MKISELFKVEGYGVVVTGGASGLGLAYAEALAENGARVTLLDVDGERLAGECARLGVADVRAFGLAWEDCEEILAELGFVPRVELVAA